MPKPDPLVGLADRLALLASASPLRILAASRDRGQPPAGELAEAADVADGKKSPPFDSAVGGTNKLAERPMSPAGAPRPQSAARNATRSAFSRPVKPMPKRPS